jgi:hypothetical protein
MRQRRRHLPDGVQAQRVRQLGLVLPERVMGFLERRGALGDTRLEACC